MNRKKTNVLFLAILIVALVLILPGCISTNYNVKINLDGSGQSKQDLAIDKSLAGLIESSQALAGKKGLEKELKNAIPNDGKYKKFTKDGKIHHQITFDFEDVEDLNATNRKLKEISNVPTPVKAKLERLDFLVFATYTFTNKFSAESENTKNAGAAQAAKAISITYKLTLPGQLTDANTDEIKENTAAWKINPTKGGKIEASSQYIRWWLVIVLIIIFLLIIVATLIAFFVAYRRFKAPTSQPESAPQQEG